MIRPAALLILTCAAATAWSADKQQVYKWTDANGVVHFSDAPPPSDTKNVQSMRLIGGTAATVSATDDQPKNVAANPTTTGAVASGQPDPAALCKQARANLELLQGATPVGLPGADGQPVPLDDAGREGQIATAKLTISRYCK